MNTIINSDIDQACSFLEKGELVAIPTETVYGLAGNALNEQAVLEIFRVKDRPSFDPLIVHVKDPDDVMHYVVDIPVMAASLMETFWPGPLTLIFKKKSIIPDLVTSGMNTVAIRMPGHPLTLELLQQLRFPLAAPSANPFGYISPTTANHVKDQLGGKIPFILDGGPCSIGLESTIVGLEDERCIVYRLGGLTLEQLRKVVPKIELQITSNSNPKAPGMMLSHYAPKKPFYFGNSKENILSNAGKNIVLIRFKPGEFPIEKNVKEFYLSEDGNFTTAARNLFSLLRQLDQNDETEIIIAEPVPDINLGKAINDRLKRASS